LKGADLNAGTFSWSFHFQIPNNCPSSIAHPNGIAKISYEIRGEIDGSGMGMLKSVRLVTVHSPLDIPKNPIAPPSIIKGEKNFLFSKNPLLMECQLDSSVCVPGGQTFVVVEIKNFSSKKVTSLSVSVVQNWKLPKGKDKVTIKDYQFRPKEFPLQTSQQFKNRIGFNIPTNIPATLTTAKLFSLLYSIGVHCYVGDTPELSIYLPITISNFQLQSTQHHEVKSTQTVNQPPVQIQMNNHPPTNQQIVYVSQPNLSNQPYPFNPQYFESSPTPRS